MSSHGYAEPIKYQFFTPGVFVLLALMLIGLLFAMARFLFGIGAVSNLNNQYPWGIWVGMDVVTGVALAAGGFTSSALAYVFNRKQYHAIVRPALLTAMFGYTFVVLGLFVDIGRYWNIWRMLISWNPNSVLFEVGMCVMIYSHVLYIEFIPLVIERFKGRVDLPLEIPIKMFNGFIQGILDRSPGFLRKLLPFNIGVKGIEDRFPAKERTQFVNSSIEKLLSFAERILDKVMFLFIIAGVVLSCLHQSALGSLMLIARYKVHALWYTPILPLLFLISAISVGYPMIVFESVISSRIFKRETEMSILTPLSGLMRYIIGIYLVLKIGDMMVRGSWVYLLDGTLQSNAFLVEMLVGVILPFVLLLFRKVRESVGLLFTVSTIYVLGLVLNRMNVFMVSYTPPYMTERYFPAIGELAVTIGLISALIFIYRVFVMIFPVISAKKLGKGATTLSLLLVSFLVFYTSGANSQESESIDAKIPVKAIQSTVSVDDVNKIHVLEDADINMQSDLYEPVRFMHSKHAVLAGDCTVCHHRLVREESDTYGEPATMDLLKERSLKPSGCKTCHGVLFDAKRLHVPGLKGAYHRLCLECHRDAAQTTGKTPVYSKGLMSGGVESLDNYARAPLDCISCHAKKTPDHNDLLELEDDVTPREVTLKCLSCHEAQGKDMLESVHWNWKGASPFSIGNEKRIDLGKDGYAISNSSLGNAANNPACTECHTGYGWSDTDFDFKDMSGIDCLVCHDTTGDYQKAQAGGGMPSDKVDLIKTAKSVGRPDRFNCGICHFAGGAADVSRHGGVNSNLKAPDIRIDVHMASDGMDFRCQECHITRNHRISGKSIAGPAVEGVFSCETCHTSTPHIKTEILSGHLNKHTDNISCQTCHIPVYGKGSAALESIDWSKAGPREKGMGTATFKESQKPVYLWYNGTVNRHMQGDLVGADRPLEINRPFGNRNDPFSRIYPFKSVRAVQPMDSESGLLIIPAFNDRHTADDWDTAFLKGMERVGLPYSGKVGFIETLYYRGLNHEVMQKENSLSCIQCHTVMEQEESCGRCHEGRDDLDFKSLAAKGVSFRTLLDEGHDVGALIGKGDYIDFRSLGYHGDPIEVGGRFKKLPLNSPGISEEGQEDAVNDGSLKNVSID